MDNRKISDAELEVMRVLWEESPLNAAVIIGKVEEKNDWSKKTIRTLIDRLCSKGFIAADKTSRVLEFKPLLSKAEYEKNTRKTLADQLYNGSIGRMLVNFVTEESLSKDEIEELKKILDELGKQ